MPIRWRWVLIGVGAPVLLAASGVIFYHATLYPAGPPQRGALALVGAIVLAGPELEPQPDATVLMRRDIAAPHLSTESQLCATSVMNIAKSWTYAARSMTESRPPLTKHDRLSASWRPVMIAWTLSRSCRIAAALTVPCS